MLSTEDRQYVAELISDMMEDLDPKIVGGDYDQSVRFRDGDATIEVHIDQWGFGAVEAVRLKLSSWSRAEIRSSMKVNKDDSGEWLVDGKKLRGKIFEAMDLAHEAEERKVLVAQRKTDFRDSLNSLSDLGEISCESGGHEFRIGFDHMTIRAVKDDSSYVLKYISILYNLVGLSEDDIRNVVKMLKKLRKKDDSQ